MRKFAITLLSALVVLLLGSCRSEFERIRTSGDPELLYAKATEYYDQEEYQRAQALYELVISSYRGRPEAEEITYRYAYTYYYLGQYVLAAYYFDNFAKTYGGSPKRQEAEFMAAYSNYRMSPNFRLDQSYSVKAIEDFQEFINQYPNSERVAEANGLIDELRAKLERKDLESARLYFELQQYQAAIQSFENLLKDYPETDRADEVRYLTIRASYLLASNSFVERQNERYRDVVKRAELYLKRYDDGQYRDEVSQMLEAANNRLKELEDVRYQNASAGAGS